MARDLRADALDDSMDIEKMPSEPERTLATLIKLTSAIGDIAVALNNMSEIISSVNERLQRLEENINPTIGISDRAVITYPQPSVWQPYNIPSTWTTSSSYDASGNYNTSYYGNLLRGNDVVVDMAYLDTAIQNTLNEINNISTNLGEESYVDQEGDIPF